MNIPKIMKGVELIGHGGPDMLRYREDIVVPTLKSYEVLVQVLAAGVNNTDINTRTAWYSKGNNDSEDASWSGKALKLPLIQGADVCGIIVAVGDQVNPKRIGERVLIEPSLQFVNGEPLENPWYFGSECNGGFAQFTLVSEQHAYPIQTSLTATELATFPCSYSTAENMLTRANVTDKDTVLVTGASGGVGSAAVQLAKARGAKVIAQTSESKMELLRSIGADEVVERSADLGHQLGKNSVDVVIDLVAGPQWPILLEVLKPKGRYAVSGAIGGAMVELDVRTLYLKDLSLFGCTVLEPQVFANLVKRIEQGAIKPLVAEVFSLQQINQAQHAFEQKSHVGKIVLDIPQ